MLKLLSHTARNFPGVFYHGKASAVLPVIVRILPFFAETAIQSVIYLIVRYLAFFLLSFREVR